jgi:hypothetical protein
MTKGWVSTARRWVRVSRGVCNLRLRQAGAGLCFALLHTACAVVAGEADSCRLRTVIPPDLGAWAPVQLRFRAMEAVQVGHA